MESPASVAAEYDPKTDPKRRPTKSNDPMVALQLTYKGLLGVLLVYVLHHPAVSEIGVPLNM